MNGEGALTITQWKQLHQAAASGGTSLERIVADLAPYAGFTINELSHLKNEWIDWGQRNVVRINIPAKSHCVNWKDGWHNFIKPRERSCRYCRRCGNTNQFEATPFDPDDNTPRSRTIAIDRTLAEPAVNLLKNIFLRQDRSTIGVHTNSLRRALNRVVEEADLDQRVTYQDLLKTQIVLYTYYDVDLDAIIDLSPYSKRTVRSIIHRTPRISHPEVNYVSDQDFLVTIKSFAPVSAAKLADELQKDKSTICRRLRRLGDRGRVEIVENPDNPEPYLWDITISPEKNFICQCGCGYTSPSLQGIKKHESWSHE